MKDVNQLITEHLDIWTSASVKKSGAGRGGGRTVSLHGIHKLRELILELAVRGKLVPQDERDEPAADLLARLKDQQANMFTEGVIKKPKPVARIDASETPFELPKNWTWCRVSQLGHDWGQKVPDTAFTYIDVGAINKEWGLVAEPNVLSAKEAPSRARKIVRQGTVIYSTVRPYLLNIAVITEEFDPEPIASTAFAIVHPFEGVMASYLYRYFRSPTFVSYVEGCQTGIAYPAINDKQFFSGLVPLPPTAEQHRIVAKVDELMELCDALERQAEGSLEAQQTLVEVCLSALTGSQTSGGLSHNWARLEANFETLFTTEESIDSLEQAIFDLAIKGALVEQSSEDEPASGFLSRNTPNWRPDGKERTLPSGWSVCTFGDLGDVTGGGTPSKSNPSFWNGDIPWVSPKDMKVDYIRDAIDKITEEAIAGSSAKLIEAGSLLVVVRGMILAHSFPVAITEVPVAVNQDMKAIDLGDLNPAYVLIMMKGMKKEFLSRVDRSTHGTCKLVSEKLWSVELPIPPLAEQARIVEQVDLLIGICRSLRKQTNASRELARCLADTLTTKLH
ncbi:restriction endonuclease subunit S [Thalassovita sp.]|uniref:restriction endonuclease subunit S n=1 Tax=Thalassovita sp. TaxID=1979401 RepID=UPI0029DE5A93|nr:restriction endonuclease subunit S [Thalassovita sp.]